MNHKFFILENDEVLNESRWFLKEDISKKAIILHDDIIANNSLFFKGFKSFKVSFKNPGEGLDYYGITLIPYTSMEDFIGNLKKAKLMKIIPEVTTIGPDGDSFTSKAVKIKPEIYSQLDKLIALCEQSIKENKYIIHFGL